MSDELVGSTTVKSSGVAKAGLTLGIIGTGLAALIGTGALGGVFGGNDTKSELAEQKAMRYTDSIGIDLYKNIMTQSNAADAKISALQREAFAYIIDLDKRTALAEQKAELNREYDTMARDYMMTIMNNKVDNCCEKVGMQLAFNKQLGELSDANIISYVNSNFLPGSLYLPAASITPKVVTQ